MPTTSKRHLLKWSASPNRSPEAAGITPPTGALKNASANVWGRFEIVSFVVLRWSRRFRLRSLQGTIASAPHSVSLLDGSVIFVNHGDSLIGIQTFGIES